MPKCDFNKVGCYLVNLLHIFRIPLPKNTSGRLLLNIWAKKSSLLSGNRRVKKVFSLTRTHSRMCIRIYIFNFKKQANKQTKLQEYKKSKRN